MSAAALATAKMAAAAFVTAKMAAATFVTAKMTAKIAAAKKAADSKNVQPLQVSSHKFPLPDRISRGSPTSRTSACLAVRRDLKHHIGTIL